MANVPVSISSLGGGQYAICSSSKGFAAVGTGNSMIGSTMYIFGQGCNAGIFTAAAKTNPTKLSNLQASPYSNCPAGLNNIACQFSGSLSANSNLVKANNKNANLVNAQKKGGAAQTKKGGNAAAKRKGAANARKGRGLNRRQNGAIGDNTLPIGLRNLVRRAVKTANQAAKKKSTGSTNQIQVAANKKTTSANQRKGVNNSQRKEGKQVTSNAQKKGAGNSNAQKNRAGNVNAQKNVGVNANAQKTVSGNANAQKNGNAQTKGAVNAKTQTGNANSQTGNGGVIWAVSPPGKRVASDLSNLPYHGPNPNTRGKNLPIT